ncbi:MAG: cellulase family glycosylhydrolase [Muribaculaceae bacterium]|nr:cellulase family glycosylhydrolase [Muribaculaceae bacterium]
MKFNRIFLFFLTLVSAFRAYSWPGMEMPVLHVDGRYLKDDAGNIVNLHGFGQTYSPWFNEQGSKWSNYDVDKCLAYNKDLIDKIMEAGWKVNFLRLHMDPYWSNTPGMSTTGENDISAFDMTRFRQYLSSVFIPMAEYAVSKGLYVVMRPPGVCPENIELGDDYQKYLKKVWGYVSTERKLVNNPHIMFELANEPVNIKGTDGEYRSWGDPSFENLTAYFREIVDLMRNNGCNNILWIPGTGYQSQYAGYAKYPIKGDNIGYAVHVYPGWYGSDAIEPSHELGGQYGGGFSKFSEGWSNQILPIAEKAPIMVTEMDWAPSVYNASWGKSITGKMLGEGFGANFKVIADRTGNVSWMIFTGPELLAQFDSSPSNNQNNTFLTDPEACPWPVYHWFKEYAGDSLPEVSDVRIGFSPSSSFNGEVITVMPGSALHCGLIGDSGNGYEIYLAADFSADVANTNILEWKGGYFIVKNQGETDITLSYSGNGKSEVKKLHVVSTLFPFVEGLFNPSIWETGSFDETTHEIKTGTYGFAGWTYSSGIDLSESDYLVAEMEGQNNSGVSFRVFDINNYWTDPAMADFINGIARFDLKALYSDSGRKLDPSHLYIIGFWSTGSAPFRISKVYSEGGSAHAEYIYDNSRTLDVYSIQGIKIKSGVTYHEALSSLPHGVYIIEGRKVKI